MLFCSEMLFTDNQRIIEMTDNIFHRLAGWDLFFSENSFCNQKNHTTFAPQNMKEQ